MGSGTIPEPPPPTPIAPVIACSGSVPGDGCAGAPAPLTAQFYHPDGFQPGGYLNRTAGTSANYMNTNCGPSGTGSCRPPWYVAGIDYAIGPYTPITSTCSVTVYDGTCLMDPALVSIPGCTWTTQAAPPSGTGGHVFVCNASTFAGTLQHLNFGPVNGHSCTGISIVGTSSNAFLMDDSYFFNDAGNCATTTSSGFVINFNAGYVGGATISNTIIDGNSSVWDTIYGSAACVAATIKCNGHDGMFFGYTPTLVAYSVIRNFAGRPLNSGSGSTTTFVFQYSWLENWDNRSPNGHAEALNGTTSLSGIGKIQFDHFVMLQGKNISPFGPNPIYFANDYPMPFFSGPFLTNGVIVDSFVGGRPISMGVSGCLGGVPTGGTAVSPICPTTPGNTFYVTWTSTGGPIGYGADLNCPIPGGGNGALMTYKEIAGPYPPGVVDEYMTDGFSPGQYGPNFVTGTIQCQNAGVGAAVANIAVFGSKGNTPYNNLQVQNNYLDVSSQNGGPFWGVGQSYSNVAVASGTITTSGGTSTLTLNSGAVALPRSGYYVVGAGIDGCGTGVMGPTTCPQITGSGTNSTWTLTAAVTPVTNIPLTLEPLSWCATPAVFSGNIDMAAIIPDATLNQWSFTSNNGGFALGCSGPPPFTPPAITPQVSSNFNPNRVASLTDNSLSPQAGATWFPTVPTNSAAFYFEMQVDPALSFGFGSQSPFANMVINKNGGRSQSNPGQPNFYFNRQWNGVLAGSWWMLSPGSSPTNQGSATAGSGYVNGIFPFTAPSSGCLRPQGGVWVGGDTTLQQTDPGLNCPATVTMNAAAIAANIPGSGAQQATSGTTCSGGVVTTNVAVAHGLTPGLTYPLAGYTPTGYNGTYTALYGTGGTILVGSTGSTSCPGAVTVEGTAFSGIGAALNFPGITGFSNGATGIATHNGQRVCGWIVENGADSSFPGSQAVAMVDEKGNSLTGSLPLSLIRIRVLSLLSLLRRLARS